MPQPENEHGEHHEQAEKHGDVQRRLDSSPAGIEADDGRHKETADGTDGIHGPKGRAMLRPVRSLEDHADQRREDRSQAGAQGEQAEAGLFPAGCSNQVAEEDGRTQTKHRMSHGSSAAGSVPRFCKW